MHRWWEANDHGQAVWTDNAPSWEELRSHTKCLRSPEEVREYFREYRARKKQEVQQGGKKQVRKGVRRGVGSGVQAYTGACSVGRAG